jgi:isoleucyl-tRNA synthetase
MEVAQQLSSMILALRRKVSIKVRQPLTAIMVPTVDDEQRAYIEAVSGLILGEVNVKELRFVDNTAGILVKRIKPDFKKLGPKCGKQMKQVAALLTSIDQASIQRFELEGFLDIDVEGSAIRVETTDVEILSEDIPGWLVANEGRLTVALDVTVTDELREEGLARELVNRIQNIRKSSDFDITDKIRIVLGPNDEIATMLKTWKAYVMTQTLAVDIQQTTIFEAATRIDMDGFELDVLVQKVD